MNNVYKIDFYEDYCVKVNPEHCLDKISRHHYDN